MSHRIVMSCLVFLIVAAPGVGFTRAITLPSRVRAQFAPAGFVLTIISWLVPSMTDEHPDTSKPTAAVAAAKLATFMETAPNCPLRNSVWPGSEERQRGQSPIER